MTGLNAVRVLRVDDDRVEAGIDEVVDRGDLRGDVLAGRDDLEFLELGRDVGLRRVGLGGLDHLDAPGVGDVAVGERDADTGRFFAGNLKNLVSLGPGHEAVSGRRTGPATISGPAAWAGAARMQAAESRRECGTHRKTANKLHGLPPRSFVVRSARSGGRES